MDDQQNNETNLKMPWLDRDGSLKEQNEIEELSKDWDLPTWESYLASIEGSQNELLFDESPSIEDIPIERLAELTFGLTKGKEHPRLKKALDVALMRLQPIEAKVIRGIYWEEKTFPQIAQEIGISSSGVAKSHRRALPKLKRLISVAMITRISKNVIVLEQIESCPRLSSDVLDSPHLSTLSSFSIGEKE